MKELVVTVCLLAAAAAAQREKREPAAPTGDALVAMQIFQRFDADRDGGVTAAEFPGSAEQFDLLDGDRDGTVTFAEFEASPLAQRLVAARKEADSAPRARQDEDLLALARLRQLARLDPDRNGRITAKEWRGSPAAFARMDANRDGRIDAADRKLLERRVPPTAAAELPEVRTRLPAAESLLANLDQNDDQRLGRGEVRREAFGDAFTWADRNGDGLLDLDELRRLVATVNGLLDARDRGTQRPRAPSIPFGAWDEDDNGRLDSNEWKGSKYLFARIDRDRDAAVTEDEIERFRRAVEGESFVERFDLNGDGKVSPREFGGSLDAFRRADRNGDGYVSRTDR